MARDRVVVMRPVSLPDFRLPSNSVPGLFVMVAPIDPAFTVMAASAAYLRASEKSSDEIVGGSLFSSSVRDSTASTRRRSKTYAHRSGGL